MGIRVPEINTATIAGRLSRDGELKYTPQGTAVLEFTVAVSRRIKGRDGSTREETGYFDCVCFGNLATAISDQLTRGKAVYIDGRLQHDEWEDRTSGQKRSRIRVVANRLQFLEWDDEAQREPQPRAVEAPKPQPQPAQQESQDDLPF